jgi:hypothetical protein
MSGSTDDLPTPRSMPPGYEASAWCRACRFTVLLDFARLVADGHGDVPLIHLPLRCRCGSDQFGIIVGAVSAAKWQPGRHARVVRQELSKPLVEQLASYMREQRTKLSRGHDLAKAIDYILKRWAAFTLFLEDGRVCLSNNAAERALRGIALGRKSWLFCGSDRGGVRAAAMYSLIVSAKMNNVDPQAWLADVLARIATYPAHRLNELLPWNWTLKPSNKIAVAA